VLGLSSNAQYGLSVQLLSILSGMAGVWTMVKWPIIAQCHARHDSDAVQRILWPRVWLQSLTFLAGCAALLACGPFLLHHFGGGKSMLPRQWMALMMLNGFLEMQFVIWGTLISLENRLPHLWPLVATNCLSLALSLALVKYTSLGLGGLVLGPLVSGMLFHYWYWPFYAARRIGTNLVRFLFVGPDQKKPKPVLVA
jgi:Na+-driven multidrug efflux pump